MWNVKILYTIDYQINTIFAHIYCLYNNLVLLSTFGCSHKHSSCKLCIKLVYPNLLAVEISFVERISQYIALPGAKVSHNIIIWISFIPIWAPAVAMNL